MYKAFIFILFFMPSVLSFSNTTNIAPSRDDITFPVAKHQELLDHFIIYFEGMIGVL
jgi:hypothetical protein